MRRNRVACVLLIVGRGVRENIDQCESSLDLGIEHARRCSLST